MTGALFSCEVLTTEDSLVIALRGELDVANAELVKSTLLASDSSANVVDLSGLTFVDSSGLTALVQGHNAVTRRGCSFEIRGASRDVRRVFEITGLTKLLGEG